MYTVFLLSAGAAYGGNNYGGARSAWDDLIRAVRAEEGARPLARVADDPPSTVVQEAAETAEEEVGSPVPEFQAWFQAAWKYVDPTYMTDNNALDLPDPDVVPKVVQDLVAWLSGKKGEAKMEIDALVDKLGDIIKSINDQIKPEDKSDDLPETSEAAFEKWMKLCLENTKLPGCKELLERYQKAFDHEIEMMNKLSSESERSAYAQDYGWRTQRGSMVADRLGRAAQTEPRSTYELDRDVRDAWSRYEDARSAWEAAVVARSSFDRRDRV